MLSRYNLLSQEGVVRWLLSPLPIRKRLPIGGVENRGVKTETVEAADIRTVRGFLVTQGVMPG